MTPPEFIRWSADEDYSEEFQDPPLSPCSGDWEANWNDTRESAIAVETDNRETVTADTVLSVDSSEQ